jgi:hypothetical protein
VQQGDCAPLRSGLVRERFDEKSTSVGYGVGRRAKTYLAGRKYCCITGEWVADDLAAGVIVGSGMLGYKVALAHEFVSALLHRAARSSVAGQFRPLSLDRNGTFKSRLARGQRSSADRRARY